MGGEDAAVAAAAGLRLRLQHHGAGAVAEQHAGGAVVPVEDAGEGLRPDHQRALVAAGPQQGVDDRQRIDEARADRLQIEGGAVGDAEPGLHRHGGGGKGLVRRRGRQHDQVDRTRLDMGIGERRAGGIEREVGGELAGGRDMAFADAGALHNPFVGGLHRTRQLVVAENSRGKIAAAAEHHRTQYGHEAAPLARRAVAVASQVARHRLADLGEQFVAHHVVTHVDGGGEAFGVGAAMAFDHDAVEAEKDAAIGLARVHLVAQRPERLPRQQIAEPRGPGPVHGRAQILARTGARCLPRS